MLMITHLITFGFFILLVFLSVLLRYTASMTHKSIVHKLKLKVIPTSAFIFSDNIYVTGTNRGPDCFKNILE